MITNCALYFPIDKPHFKSVFPKGRSDGGLFRQATWFEYDSGAGVVRLKLQHPDLAEHLRGFRAYVAQLPNSGKARAEAQDLIGQTRASVGVILPGPVGPDSAAFSSLMMLLQRFGGFMFVGDSIMLPNGRFVVGPLADDGDEKDSVQTIRPVNPADCRHKGPTEGVAPTRIAAREHVYQLLAERGFRCTRSLPLYRSEDQKNTIRPLEEIAGRLLALKALFLWVSAESIAGSERLRRFVDRNGLQEHLTSEERAIFSLPRGQANALHANTIGWRLENMWALGWILGFDPAPPFFQGQLPNEIVESVISNFLPNLDGVIADFVNTVRARTPDEVAHLEDVYYCAHNAVRSAQMGADTVPSEFHPVRDGGAIHERRHTLTWSLSPGVDWEDTDLST
jgi:hypothetical protein